MDSKVMKYDLPRSVEKRLINTETPYVFARNAKKSEIYNKPLLIIGLGGSGYDALSRAKEKMVSCFKTNNKGELEGVEFLEIDTDDRDMNECLNKPKQGRLTKTEFKIFQNADIGAILRNRNKNTDILPKEIEEWLDPNIPVAQIVHGAAGIRQAGRLLLHLNAIEVIDVIKNKLDKIRQSVVLSKNPVNVVILTGIGGGTGSGTFVDISYIVRKCINDFSGRAFITGIILMPDILTGDPNVDKYTKENIKRNGFAALKELDHLMNLSETQDSFTQRFPGGFVVEETDEAIFDRCFLVSSMVEGRLLLPRAKEHAYNIAAEMLIDMISNSSTVSKGSNDVSRRDTALVTMKDRKPANYVYNAVGGQAVYFDFDLAFNLFIKNVLEYDVDMIFTREQISKRVEKTMKEEEIKEAIDSLVDARKNFISDGRNLYELVCDKFDENTKKHNTDTITLSYIKAHPEQTYELTEVSDVRVKLDAELQDFSQKAKKLGEKIKGIYDGIDIRDDDYITELKNEIQGSLNRTLVGLEYVGEESELQKYEKKLEKYRLECLKIKKKGMEPKDWMKKLGIGRGVDIEEPSKALQRISNQEAIRIKNEKYKKVVGELINKIGSIFISKHREDSAKVPPEMKDFYNTARITWLDILRSKYDNNYSPNSFNLETRHTFVQESVETVWEKNDALLGKFSIVPDDDIRKVAIASYIKTIEKIIQDDNLSVDKAAREYKRKMTDTTLTELFQGETGISPVITTGQVFEQLFSDVNISLDDIVMNLLDIKKPELEIVWGKVVQAILDHSGVLYSKKAMKDGEVFERPDYDEFMIPKNNKMLASVCKELTGREADESEISHRISCMKYTLCHKIDDYIYIDELERAYNMSNSKFGLHLYENDKCHWAKLPSPVYRNRIADDLKMDEYEDAKMAEKYRYIFLQAWAHLYFGWLTFKPSCHLLMVS